MQQKSPKPNKSRAEDATTISSPTTTEKKSLDDSTLVTSPTTNESAPCFNENYNISDVLARSPSGSVADLTQIQSDSEMDKSVEGSIQEPVRQQESIETKQDSGPVETAKEESVENPEELEAEMPEQETITYTREKPKRSRKNLDTSDLPREKNYIDLTEEE